MIVYSRIPELKGKEKAVSQHKYAHALLECMLQHFYGLSKEECEVAKKENGKPYLKNREDIFISISHCDGMVAVSAGKNEQGVDIEKVRPVKETIYNRVLSENEKLFFMESGRNRHVFFRFWTLKESFVKTTGEGLRRDIKNIEFQLFDDKVTANQKNYYFYSSCIFHDFVLAYCEGGGTKENLQLYFYEDLQFHIVSQSK